MTVVDRLTVIPVGRGDHVISLRVYRADDLATTRELAALRTKVAEQALTIAALERNGVDEARGLYAGRFCGRELRIVARRARNAEEKRRYYAANADYREREKARVAVARDRASGAATGAGRGGR